jgi:hypothetical protein
MKDHVEIDDRIGGALAILKDIEMQTEAALAILRTAASDTGSDGKLTKAALEARQRLRNPEGNLSRISVVVKDMARSDKGAKRIRLSESAADAKRAATRAVNKAVEAEIALKAFDEKRDTYLAQSGSRKRSPEQLVDAHEGRTFMTKLVERGSPVSILDQLSADEMDFFHALLVDKAQDPAHRKPNGAWHAMMRAGFIDFRVNCLSSDERHALLIATDDIKAQYFEAMQAFEAAAGRKLDLSPGIAIALLEVMLTPDLRPGVSRLRTAAATIQFDEDINRLIRLLGLEPKDWQRVSEIMEPTMVRLREERYTRLAEEAADAERKQALLLRYIPYARLSLEKVHQASRADERKLVGVGEDGRYDPVVARRCVQALPEHDDAFYLYPGLRYRVNCDSFLEDCEADREREVQTIAYYWAGDKETRDRARAKGVSLPEPEDLPDEWPALAREGNGVDVSDTMDDLTPLKLPLTDEQARIIERKVYWGGDPTKQVWAPAASPVVPVVPVVPSDVVRSISGGEGFSEDEAQKLAELLFYEFKGATNPLWDGTGLVVGEMDRAVLLPALRVAVLYSGYSKQKEFLAAVERGDHEQFVAQYKAPQVQMLKEGLMAGSPKYLDRARERGLLP